MMAMRLQLKNAITELGSTIMHTARIAIGPVMADGGSSRPTLIMRMVLKSPEQA